MPSRSLSRRSRAVAIAGVAAILTSAAAVPASASAPTGGHHVAVASSADVTPVRDFVGISGDAFNGGTDFVPTAQIREMGGSNYLAVRVQNTDTETLTIVASSVYGEVTKQVATGTSYYVAFPMRTTDVPYTRLSIAAWVEDGAGQMVRGSSANLVNIVLPQG